LHRLILLYLQFRWLERNTVYNRWVVSFTRPVMDTALQVRYDAMNFSEYDAQFFSKLEQS
jgi:hypothetical protein